MAIARIRGIQGFQWPWPPEALSFRRANGSYRYKRNVPKALREVIPKATVYRQLGDSYDEAIRRLPVVHAEVEALFDQERSTPNSVRAKSIVRERLGEWHAEVFGSKGTICA